MKPLTIALIPVLALTAACSSPLETARRSDLNPPTIGGPGDNLRIGEAPPASPSDVAISTYDPKSSDTGVTRIRGSALQEAAQSYGSQGGYARRAWEIMNRLEVQSANLSQVFDFNRVVSAAPVKAGVIVPPVVSRSFDAFVTNAGGSEASVADEYLTIVRPGKIAAVAPTWRDYLLFVSAAPDEPARSLMPSDAQEKDLFRKHFDEGWAAGIELADAEFGERVDRLKRDYQGMLQYRRLVAQGMMDRMVLADADFGVTKDGNEMRIGSRTVEIVSNADFQSDPSRWQVRSVSARDALIVDAGEVPALSKVY